MAVVRGQVIFASQEMAPSTAVLDPRSNKLGNQKMEYAIATAAIVLLFAALQTAHILRQFNSPSVGEAHAAIAGLRTLDGHGWSDGYLRVLPGSLLWPVLSGGAFDLWGTAGPRLIALLLVVAGFLALRSATQLLFGDRAACFTIAALALSAPFWIAGHFGSMEALALASVCVAVWAIARLAQDDHRGWLLLATFMLTMAMLAQYRAALMLIPASMLLAALRRKRAPIDIGLMWLLAGLALVVYFDLASAQIVHVLSPDAVVGLSRGDGTTESATATRAVIVLWGVLPVLASAIAWRRNRALRPIIAALTVWPAIWVAVWVLSASSGTTLVYLDLALGTVLLYPVVGLLLSQIGWNRARLVALGAAMLGLALLSGLQTQAFDQGWPDSSESVAALVDSMQPGDQVLSNERWPYALALYQANRIDGPNDVLDEALLFDSDVVFDFCSFSWFVDSGPVHPWSALVQTGIGSCGTFEVVVTASSQVTSLSDGLREREQTVHTTVRRNMQPFQEEA